MTESERRLQEVLNEPPLSPEPRPRPVMTSVKQNAVTATRIREALKALLDKTNEAVHHASRIAPVLDGGATVGAVTAPTPARPEPAKPLFEQFASQIVQISQAVDLIEAQLRRMDEMLA